MSKKKPLQLYISKEILDNIVCPGCNSPVAVCYAGSGEYRGYCQTCLILFCAKPVTYSLKITKEGKREDG